MTIGEMVGIAQDIRTFEPTDRLSCNRTYVGIEVEVENIRVPADVPMWLRKADGSLRNNGVEYVFADPMKGRDVVDAVQSLYTYLNSGKPDFSERCGLHVHLDVRSLSLDEYLSLIYHTVLVERALYKYCGNGRDDNVFCLPFYKAQYSLAGMAEGAKLRDILHYGAKYMGTNIGVTKEYGSIEYRMHPGTNSPEKVIDWVNILLNLKLAAVSNANNLDNILYTVSARGVLDYVTNMFRNAPQILPYVTRDDMLDGMRNVQLLIEAKKIKEAAEALPRKLTNVSLVKKFFGKHGYNMDVGAAKATTVTEVAANYYADVIDPFERMLQRGRDRVPPGIVEPIVEVHEERN